MRFWRLRYHFCELVGHKFRLAPTSGGRECTRCGERRPLYKQRFGHVDITGPSWDQDNLIGEIQAQDDETRAAARDIAHELETDFLYGESLPDDD